MIRERSNPGVHGLPGVAVEHRPRVSDRLDERADSDAGASSELRRELHERRDIRRDLQSVIHARGLAGRQGHRSGDRNDGSMRAADSLPGRVVRSCDGSATLRKDKERNMSGDSISRRREQIQTDPEESTVSVAAGIGALHASCGKSGWRGESDLNRSKGSSDLLAPRGEDKKPNSRNEQVD